MTGKKKETAAENPFRAAMRDVTPLVHTKITPASPKPRAFRKKHPKPDVDNASPGLEAEFSDYEKLPLVDTNTPLAWARPNLPHKTLRKLHNGQYNSDAVLDLHGKTVDEARSALAHFLFQCQQQDIRHVIVIHGKGNREPPLLKNRLNHWLRQTEPVLAFCTARPWDGGQGALYVLLRRKPLVR